jgi:hypothetical protein
MLVVESSMAGGRKEVALAAIAVITTVMQAHGTTKAVSRRYHRALCRSYVSCKPTALPRQFLTGITAFSIVHACLASPRHHQGRFTQVSPRSLLFMRVLQAHGTTKAVSHRYHRILYCSCVSCKLRSCPGRSHAGITALTVIHACLCKLRFCPEAVTHRCGLARS